MSLTFDVNFFHGTENQKNVGILGRASINILVSNNSLIKLNNVELRQKKSDGSYYLKYPAEKDRNGAVNEQGYVKEYSYYILFPDDKSGMKDRVLQAVVDAFESTTNSKSSQKSRPAPASNSASKANSGKITSRPTPPPPPVSNSSDNSFDWES